MKPYFPKLLLIAIGLVGIHCHSTYINTNIRKMSQYNTSINALSIYNYYM